MDFARVFHNVIHRYGGQPESLFQMKRFIPTAEKALQEVPIFEVKKVPGMAVPALA
jgi:hypothetical protein